MPKVFHPNYTNPAAARSGVHHTPKKPAIVPASSFEQPAQATSPSCPHGLTREELREFLRNIERKFPGQQHMLLTPWLKQYVPLPDGKQGKLLQVFESRCIVHVDGEATTREVLPITLLKRLGLTERWWVK